MRIIRRNWANPKSTMYIWIIPTINYVLLKFMGSILPNKEWIWWVTLSLAFTFWIGLTFKIDKNK